MYLELGKLEIERTWKPKSHVSRPDLRIPKVDPRWGSTISLRLQVHKQYLLWGLRYVNMTYFWLFGAPGYERYCRSPCWAQPERRSTLGIYILHHRSISSYPQVDSKYHQMRTRQFLLRQDMSPVQNLLYRLCTKPSPTKLL